MGCTTTKTPNIDQLVTSEALLLSNHYTANRCSPTRSAFMTGRYPSTLGLQDLMFSVEYPVALTRSVSTISDELKAAGYSTHAVGYVVHLKNAYDFRKVQGNGRMAMI